MTVIEFIKKYGWEHSKDVSNGWITNYENIVLNELKSYIEAYELVIDFKHLNNGRWHFIADYCSKSKLLSPFDSEVYNMVGAKYDKAIKLVEEIEC